MDTWPDLPCEEAAQGSGQADPGGAVMSVLEDKVLWGCSGIERRHGRQTARPWRAVPSRLQRLAMRQSVLLSVD